MVASSGTVAAAHESGSSIAQPGITHPIVAQSPAASGSSPAVAPSPSSGAVKVPDRVEKDRVETIAPASLPRAKPRGPSRVKLGADVGAEFLLFDLPPLVLLAPDRTPTD